jgi:translation initiation factor 1
MRENLFEIGADLGDGWKSDNKNKNTPAKVPDCKEVLAPEKHQLHFAKEKRRGKVVTIVKPFCLAQNNLKDLLKNVKKKLGTGGTVKENTLEFQGELQMQLRTVLENLNYRFKK